MRRKSSNPWKIAFLSVVGILIIGFVGIYATLMTLARPTTITKTQVQQPQQETVMVQMTMSTKQAEQLLNETLQEKQTGTALSLSLGEEVIINGETTVLGLKLPAQVIAKPYRTTEGNIQLKVTDFKVANTSVPTNMALSIFSHATVLPSWLQTDSQEQLIVIRLDILSSEIGAMIKLKEIDTATQEYHFTVEVTQKELLEKIMK